MIDVLKIYILKGNTVSFVKKRLVGKVGGRETMPKSSRRCGRLGSGVQWEP